MPKGYQYGPTGSVDQEFVDIERGRESEGDGESLREREREREKEGKKMRARESEREGVDTICAHPGPHQAIEMAIHKKVF